MNENIQHAMEQLLAVGGLHAHLLPDDTIEIHPAPDSALFLVAAGILEAAGLRKLQDPDGPYGQVWGPA